jgi:hypothetical protein
MRNLSRRAFVELSLGGAAALCLPQGVSTAQQCDTGGLPAFLPNSLTVDCGSRRNFRAFRQNPDYLGLAGAVSMTFVRGARGSYPAGNLFLFPWIKPKGQALKGRTWPAVVLVNSANSAPMSDATLVLNSSPIPNATLPLDEYFCRFILQAPWTSFIGFQIDTPVNWWEAQWPWYTNVDKLADGKGIGICWTSHNLNGPWFGGSHWIPDSDACNGSKWRKLITAALEQASVGAC